jgi:hypothetical protein
MGIDKFDISFFRRFLKIAETEGTDSIKLVAGDKAHTYEVWVKPRPDGFPRLMNPVRNPNPLDGLTNERARKKVYYIMSHFTHGIFNDESWVPVNGIWKAFNNIGLDWSMTNSFYRKDVYTGEPNAKVWVFEVRFINKSRRLTTMHGTVTAAGAGTVADPLVRYDLVAQVF